MRFLAVLAVTGALALLAWPTPALGQSEDASGPPGSPAAPAYQPLGPPDWSPYVQREELGPKGDLATAVRVLRFVQVSDAHILDDDAPFPLRVEQLDPFITAYSTSAQRPQDEYTDEVLASLIQAINAQQAADPLQFVVNTGDNVDNDLENELMRFIDLYDGTTTTTGPVSGMACLPDGQSADVQDGAQDVTDSCTSLPLALAGNHTGLVPGLPWYSAFGNHDALIQGNVNVEPSFQEVAGEVGRHFLHQPEAIAMHFPGAQTCPAGPAGSEADDFGHGFGFAGERLCDADPDNDGYYAFSVGGVRFIVLDTVNDDFFADGSASQGAFSPQQLFGSDVFGGLAEGAIDPAQVAWMEEEITDHPDSLIVLFSHHTINSMFTDRASGACDPFTGQCLDTALQAAGYETGPQIITRLAQHPNVVAWIGGHTHRNHIEAKGAEGAGFWNIESSSLIDLPQEARTIELWASDNGTKGFLRLTDFVHTFQASLDLADSDPQADPESLGQPQDRDVLLWFDVPAGVQLPALPDPPRQWRIRVLEPTGEVPSGGFVNVTLALDDLLHPDGPVPPVVTAGWSGIGAGPRTEPLDLGLARAGVGLSTTQNASTVLAHASFQPKQGGTYYAIVEFYQEGKGQLAEQLVSIRVADPPGQLAKQSPGVPLAAALLVLAALALARRHAVQKR